MTKQYNCFTQIALTGDGNTSMHDASLCEKIEGLVGEALATHEVLSYEHYACFRPRLLSSAVVAPTASATAAAAAAARPPPKAW